MNFKALYLEFFFPPKTPYLTLLSHISELVMLWCNKVVYYTTGYVLFCCSHTITGVMDIHRHNQLSIKS